MTHDLRWLLLVLAAGLGGACTGNPADPEGGEPGLHLVAGATDADTVQSELAWLVVEVRDADGLPMGDAEVEFRSSRTAEGMAAVGFGDSGSGQVSGRTDGQGRLGMTVRAGVTAGPAFVVVRAAAVAETDTAHYTVLPGAIASIRFSPEDTTVSVGAEYTVSAEPTDRWGNPAATGTSDVRLSTTGTVASASEATVAAIAVGRVAIHATAAGLSGTLWVTVVPAGRIAAAFNGGIREFDLDGSDMRTLVPEGAFNNPSGLAWAPDASRLLFHEEYGYLNGQILYGVDADGVVTPVTGGSADHGEIWGRYDPPGDWIYYTAYRGTGTTVWRCRPDGSEAGPVPGLVSVAGLNEAAGAISPDGGRMAYVRILGYSDVVAIMNLATLQIDSSVATGHTPEWAPDGGRLVIVVPPYTTQAGGSLALIAADGTDLGEVGDGAGYVFGPRWSADGEWIMARNATRDRLELIDPDSGMVLPLSFTTGYAYPAWKP